jgi:hypothetical protein
MNMHSDVAFPSCSIMFLWAEVQLFMTYLVAHHMHVLSLVCTPCHEFGGLTAPEFLADSSCLDWNTSHGSHARI